LKTAVEARRLYYKEWRLKNKEKVKANNERYWLKKANSTNEDKQNERN